MTSLQAGIKIIVQTPQGIKPNLHSFYSSDLVRDEEFYAGGKVGVWCPAVSIMSDIQTPSI